jgi:hypothetical protein
MLFVKREPARRGHPARFSLFTTLVYDAREEQPRLNGNQAGLAAVPGGPRFATMGFWR